MWVLGLFGFDFQVGICAVFATLSLCVDSDLSVRCDFVFTGGCFFNV